MALEIEVCRLKKVFGMNFNTVLVVNFTVFLRQTIVMDSYFVILSQHIEIYAPSLRNRASKGGRKRDKGGRKGDN